MTTTEQDTFNKLILDKIREERNNHIHAPSYSFPNRRSTPITKNIEDNRKELDNVEKAQDIKLKKQTLWTLFTFLGIETVAVFSFAFLQATDIWKFEMEEWSFKLLLSATITQITIMLLVAVKHLFPKK